MLIDTHCHLDLEQFVADRDAVVARAADAGVSRMIVPALGPENWQAVIDLADKYAEVYVAVGVHPNSSADWDDGWIADLRRMAHYRKVVAIGEIGLDYYWDKSPKETQQRALRLQLELADELNLPVIIHNRESDEDVLRLLAESPLAGKENPGVLHSFSTTWAVAETVLEMGFYLGFTGPVTFKKAHELREVVAKVPVERILVETDAPFLTPQPYRGKRNEPAYVAFVAERCAAVRGMDTAVFAQQSVQNAQRLFARMVDDG